MTIATHNIKKRGKIAVVMYRYNFYSSFLELIEWYGFCLYVVYRASKSH
jgi:hypothetical protein